MLSFGLTCLFIGNVLLVLTLFVWIPSDRLPSYLEQKTRLDDKFPPGIVLSVRVVTLWVSGGFWGIGAAFVGWNDPVSADTFLSVFAVALLLTVLQFIVFALAGSKR